MKKHSQTIYQKLRYWVLQFKYTITEVNFYLLISSIVLFVLYIAFENCSPIFSKVFSSLSVIALFNSTITFFNTVKPKLDKKVLYYTTFEKNLITLRQEWADFREIFNLRDVPQEQIIEHISIELNKETSRILFPQYQEKVKTITENLGNNKPLEDINFNAYLESVTILKNANKTLKYEGSTYIESCSLEFSEIIMHLGFFIKEIDYDKKNIKEYSIWFWNRYREKRGFPKIPWN